MSAGEPALVESGVAVWVESRAKERSLLGVQGLNDLGALGRMATVAALQVTVNLVDVVQSL